MMHEIDPTMNMSPSEGMRRFRIDDAIDDVLIAEIMDNATDEVNEETTLQRLCRELHIDYTEAMRVQERDLATLAELGQTGARLAKLRDIIEQYDHLPPALN